MRHPRSASLRSCLCLLSADLAVRLYATRCQSRRKERHGILSRAVLETLATMRRKSTGVLPHRVDVSFPCPEVFLPQNVYFKTGPKSCSCRLKVFVCRRACVRRAVGPPGSSSVTHTPSCVQCSLIAEATEANRQLSGARSKRLRSKPLCVGISVPLGFKIGKV